MEGWVNVMQWAQPLHDSGRVESGVWGYGGVGSVGHSGCCHGSGVYFRLVCWLP